MKGCTRVIKEGYLAYYYYSLCYRSMEAFEIQTFNKLEVFIRSRLYRYYCALCHELNHDTVKAKVCKCIRSLMLPMCTVLHHLAVLVCTTFLNTTPWLSLWIEKRRIPIFQP
jgi:hypothetical protein